MNIRYQNAVTKYVSFAVPKIEQRMVAVFVLIVYNISSNDVIGGINPNQYAERFIFQNGGDLERYDIECSKALWKTLGETFGSNMTVMKFDNDKILIKIKCIPSLMREWRRIKYIGDERFVVR